MKILINGNFLNRNLTGIERFALETCSRLDKIIKPEDEFFLLAAKNAKFIPDFKNIKIIQSEKRIKAFPLWDMITFKKALKKTGAYGLNFSNTAPLGKYAGFSFIHDIYAKDCPKDFSSFKDRLIRLYSCFSYRNIAKNADMVFTVSSFSRKRIMETYGTKEDKITVIPNGWEHFKEIKSDEDVFKRFPLLLKKDFFFTLGSLSKRKNLKWICEYASKHPDDFFAVSGKTISGLVPPELEALKKLSNVLLLGYVSDGEVEALMEKCRAFVMPSYYEGFGIPPLEALSCGARIIVSNSTSLEEIYREYAGCINPDSADTDLNELLKEKKLSPAPLLEKYTYSNAAKLLYESLKKSIQPL